MSTLNTLPPGPTAHIIVGSGANTKSFHVHKKLLCDSSTYFKAALNNGFAETRDQTVTLDDEEPAIIHTFVRWLYEGKLNKNSLPSEIFNGALENYLFKLYVFADKRGIGNLVNDTITMLASYWTQDSVALGEVEAETKFIGALTPLDLPRKFLTDLLCKSHELSEAFDAYDKCLQAVCHYHCYEGQGLRSKVECIRNTEAGYNIYGEHGNLVQLGWEGDV